MSEGITGVSIYLLAGMQVKISCPVDPSAGTGYFAMSGFVAFKNYSKQLENGFLVEDTNIGKISAIPGEPAVMYVHMKPFNNSIWFFSRNGDKGVVNIISVPIHDHSSIMQGGPAYGTYFSDSEVVE